MIIGGHFGRYSIHKRRLRSVDLLNHRPTFSEAYNFLDLKRDEAHFMTLQILQNSPILNMITLVEIESFLPELRL